MRQYKFVLLLSLLFFSSCSWFSSQKQGMVEYAPRVVNNIPEPKPIRREPGSLWSEDSGWNDIYSPNQSRHPGDVITIKLDAGLKQKIVSLVMTPDRQKQEKELLERELRNQKEMAKRNEEALKAGQEIEKPIPSENLSAANSSNDTKSIEAVILEVMPRGVYKVSANRGVRVGPRDPYIALRAQVREKEIGPDESVSSDALFDVQMDVIQADETKVVKEEKK
jgi:flagellar basal body L-ring protein FlgH